MSSSARPITLADFATSLKDLPDDAIQSVQAGLERSLEKLHETNDILRAEIPASDHTDQLIYQEALDENLETIENQKKRLEAVASELSSRGVEQGILL